MDGRFEDKLLSSLNFGHVQACILKNNWTLFSQSTSILDSTDESSPAKKEEKKFLAGPHTSKQHLDLEKMIKA